MSTGDCCRISHGTAEPPPPVAGRDSAPAASADGTGWQIIAGRAARLPPAARAASSLRLGKSRTIATYAMQLNLDPQRGGAERYRP